MAPTNPQPLYKRLQAKYLHCSLSLQKYLPLDIIDAEITVETVKAEMKRKPISSQHLKNVVQKAKKVFAILAIIGEIHAIEDLLSDGITDDHLPLSRKEGSGDEVVLVSAGSDGKEFPSFATWHDIRVGDFLDRQWIVQAPVLDDSGRQVYLNSQCALPFLKVDEVGSTGSSTVYRSEVHPAHQKGLQVIGGVVQVAAKEFRRDEPFRKERENLHKIQDIRHPHLIQHLVTYEKAPQYYVIFPWAHGGSLTDFWERKDRTDRTRKLALWSLQQMLGIAGALEALHDVNCRHGDLKPANILHFINDKSETLVVADVGVSKIHGKSTGLRRGGTKTRATTPAYEAPEAFLDEENPRARRYDIWSLGCIFLEYIIWFLEDLTAVERFTSTRETPEYEFYVVSQGEAEVHPTVNHAIDSIKKDIRCKGGTALEALVNLIADHMLQVEVDKRDTADIIVEKLSTIVLEAEQNQSRLFNEVDSASAPANFHFIRRQASMAYKSDCSTIHEEPSFMEKLKR